MLIRFVLIVVTGSILILLWMNIRMQYLKNIISDTIVVHGKTISEDKNEYDYDTMVARYGNSDDNYYLLLRGFKQIKPSY